MAEGRLPKIALKWMPKQKRARGRPKKNWMEGIKKAVNERNLNEGQWEDGKQWSLGVGQRTKKFRNRYIHIFNKIPRKKLFSIFHIGFITKNTNASQPAAAVLSHKSMLKVFSTTGAVGSKGINIYCAWFVTLY
jgi:hypothetical protein